MLQILNIIFRFLVFLFFYSKEELDYKSKHFNPIRILVFILFVISIALNIYLIKILNDLYEKIKNLVPN